MPDQREPARRAVDLERQLPDIARCGGGAFGIHAPERLGRDETERGHRAQRGVVDEIIRHRHAAYRDGLRGGIVQLEKVVVPLVIGIAEPFVDRDASRRGKCGDGQIRRADRRRAKRPSLQSRAGASDGKIRRLRAERDRINQRLTEPDRSVKQHRVPILIEPEAGVQPRARGEIRIDHEVTASGDGGARGENEFVFDRRIIREAHAAEIHDRRAVIAQLDHVGKCARDVQRGAIVREDFVDHQRARRARESGGRGGRGRYDRGAADEAEQIRLPGRREIFHRRPRRRGGPAGQVIVDELVKRRVRIGGCIRVENRAVQLADRVVIFRAKRRISRHARGPEKRQQRAEGEAAL